MLTPAAPCDTMNVKGGTMSSTELDRRIDMISQAMRDAADDLDMSFGMFVARAFGRILGRLLGDVGDTDVLQAEDLKVDTYRAGDSNSVRITHLPTGFVQTSANHQSEIQNKAEALRILRQRLSRIPSGAFKPW